MHYRVTHAPGKTVYLLCRIGYTSGLFMEAIDEAQARPLLSKFKYTQIEVKGAKAKMDYKAYYDKLYK
jgi:cellobiose-specific phosphotransferase system component IIB